MNATPEIDPSSILPDRATGSGSTPAGSGLAGRTFWHPLFLEAVAVLSEELENQEGAPIPLLIGAPGFGKSKVIEVVGNRIAADLAPAMAEDPNLHPVIAIEAQPPHDGDFDHTMLLLQILAALGQPTVRWRVGNALEGPGAMERAGMARRVRGIRDLKLDVQAALVLHGTRVLFIDEVAQMRYMKDQERYLLPLDTLKWLANATGVRFVCVGSYDALGFRNLSGQLGRRQTQIHARRYRGEDQRDVAAFGRVADEMLVAVGYEGDPGPLHEALFRGSAGTVGSMKDWLAKAVHLQRKWGLPLEDALRLKAWPEDTISHWVRLMETGELAFAPTTPEVRAELDGLLGLGPKPKPTVAPSATFRTQQRRPGERNPSRDPSRVSLGR